MYTARPRRTCSAPKSPSPESPATSRRRSSARPATRRGWRRTPTAPGVFCCSTREARRLRRRAASSPPARRKPTPSHWKEASSSAARWCSGCATACASSRNRSTSRSSPKELRVDGGAAADDLLMQFQADLLGVPVVRPRVLETTALGAAYLAGLATGVWASREEIAKQWKVAKRFEPKMKREEGERRMGEWKRALERAGGWGKG